MTYWQLAWDIAAASTYVLNWQLAARATDYFGQEDAPSLVLHFWSLSVEEQFYLVWPLLIVGIALFARARLRNVTTGVLIPCMVLLWFASFAVCVVLTWRSQPYAFFGTPARVWQLMTGALIVVAGVPLLSPAVRGCLGWGGLAAILLSIYFYTSETPYPGYAALLPTLGAAGVIAAGVGASMQGGVSTLLSAPALTSAGKVSYSWYLWHFPVLILGEKIWPDPAAGYWLLLIGVSLLLAIASYFLIENPIRYNPTLIASTLKSLSMGAAVTAGSLAAAAFLYVSAKETKILIGGRAPIALDDFWRDKPLIYRVGCHLEEQQTELPDCSFGDKAAKRAIFLFGDSHAAHWFPAVDAAAKKAHIRLIPRTKSGCPSIDVPVRLYGGRQDYPECVAWRTKVIEEMAAVKPELVIISNSSAPSLYPVLGLGPLPKEEALALHKQALGALVDKLAQVGTNVLTISETPRFPDHPLACLLAYPNAEQNCALARKEALPPDPTNGLPPNPHLQILDAADLICDSTCPAAKGGHVVMYDRHHLTASYAATLAPAFAGYLQPVPARQTSLRSGERQP
jgi:peptidoglycan/LPS O-acetylase OafA/YrhL